MRTFELKVLSATGVVLETQTNIDGMRLTRILVEWIDGAVRNEGDSVTFDVTRV